MSSQEKDFLIYKGNKVPRIIRLAWTVLLVFSVVYLAQNVLPDLAQWIQRVR